MDSHFWSTIDAAIAAKSLLKHPFYQAWSAGQLTREDLQTYAQQYYFLEKNFPRFLSRIHSNCEDQSVRQHILQNLNDEEQGSENHAELWLRFAEGLGTTREAVRGAQALPETDQCVETFQNLSSNSEYAMGLAALYSYESQIPPVAKTKIDGLQKWYGINDERTIKFFKVHQEADVWHSAAEKEMISSAPATTEQITESVRAATEALWKFLDGVYRVTCGPRLGAMAC